MNPPTPQQPQDPSTETPAGFEPKRNATLEGILNTLEWLLVALILALVFRAFAVEAFQIPTGSMAETLKGAHYSLRCVRCGYAYEVGGDSSLLNRPQCPSCGYSQLPTAIGRIQNGDRIFVLKCLYPFFKPEPWDVVVFKNPADPQQNYIKRLIGLPGQTVQIIDGDIYIDGQIQRKPARVQRELWMCIYDNDYQPFSALSLPKGKSGPAGQAGLADAENRPWRQPFENESNSRWNLSANGPTVFGLDEPGGQTHTLIYNSSVGNDFHAAYAYNNDRMRQAEPICSDLMMRFFVQKEEEHGFVGVSLEKNGVHYIARAEFGKRLVLEKEQDGSLAELKQMPIERKTDHSPVYFEFADVDRRLIFHFGDQRLSFDLPVCEPVENHGVGPTVKISGSGHIRLRHIGLYRDLYYVSDGILRATAKKPFTLGRDEFFVCGDNSPNSYDGRLWSAQGKDQIGRPFYREGIVPMDYMMGKAFFVYWSEPFSPAANMMPVIPNIGQLKVVVGGSEEVY
jgi:signal peptidase I